MFPKNWINQEFGIGIWIETWMTHLTYIAEKRERERDSSILESSQRSNEGKKVGWIISFQEAENTTGKN